MGKAALEKQQASKSRMPRPAGYSGSRSLSMPDEPKKSAARFRISGVDRETQMDVVEYIFAATAENAKAKAELRGIVVTTVEEE
jgi:ACT domain-containing protein